MKERIDLALGTSAVFGVLAFVALLLGHTAVAVWTVIAGVAVAAWAVRGATYRHLEPARRQRRRERSEQLRVVARGQRAPRVVRAAGPVPETT